MQYRRQHSAGFFRLDAFQTQCAGAVSEYHRDVSAAGGDVQAGAVDFSTDKKNPVVKAASDKGICGGDTVNKSGALLADIQSRRGLQPQFVLKQTARTRKVDIRAERGKDNQIDIIRFPPRPFKGDF